MACTPNRANGGWERCESLSLERPKRGQTQSPLEPQPSNVWRSSCSLGTSMSSLAYSSPQSAKALNLCCQKNVNMLSLGREAPPLIAPLPRRPMKDNTFSLSAERSFLSDFTMTTSYRPAKLNERPAPSSKRREEEFQTQKRLSFKSMNKEKKS